MSYSMSMGSGSKKRRRNVSTSCHPKCPSSYLPSNVDASFPHNVFRGFPLSAVVLFQRTLVLRFQFTSESSLQSIRYVSKIELPETPHRWLFSLLSVQFMNCLISPLDEECLQQGVEYMPASLQQKKPRDREKDGERGRNFQRGNGAWAPDSSDEGGSDSEDSMSDLYPC